MNNKCNNSIPSVTDIVSGMNTISPKSNKSNRGTSYESIATEYLLRTVNELGKAILLDNGNCQMYVTHIRQEFDYRYNNGKRWLDWLNSCYPLYIMIQKGNILSNKPIPSEVKSLVSQQELIEYRSNQDFSSIYPTIEDADWNVPINTKSLINFIIKGCELYPTLAPGKYRNKVVRNVCGANEILDVATLHKGVLPMSAELKPFGRYYANGVNIQNTVSTEVREAALGKCYKYDISSAAYAFKLGYIKLQRPDLKTPALRELVENKTVVRHRLVTECLIATKGSVKNKTKYVKDALNMLGFGAKTGPFGSIKEAIWSIEDSKRFVEHWYVKELMGELNLFTKLLLEDVGKKALKEYLQLEKGQNYSQGKAESKLYQQAETEIMKTVFANTKGNSLLWVHDCVYTSKPQGVGNLNYHLHSDPIWRYATFTEEKIDAWTKPANYYVITPAQEEQLAEQYVSNFAQGEGFSKWDQQQLNKQAWRELYEVQ